VNAAEIKAYAEKLVERTTREQGVPKTVTDAATLRRIAQLARPRDERKAS
jgi:hypothetical protein